MTVKEFYKYCEKNKCQDAEILIIHNASDDWYSLNTDFSKRDINFIDKNHVAIEFTDS